MDDSRVHHVEVSGEALVQNPVVSVVVLAYNHAPFLEQAVQSVAEQKADFDFEVLIAEDCSTDETRSIALALQRRYPRLVRVIYTQANKGGNRNARLALSLARGRYIAACEGDDFWSDSQKLVRQVSALERLPGVDLAFTRGDRLYPDGHRAPDWDYGREERIVDPQELFSGFDLVTPNASLVWRTRVTADLPAWFDDAPFGDLMIIMAASLRGGAYYDPANTVCYRVAQPTSFSVAITGASPAKKIAFLQEAIKYVMLACDYFGFPRRHVSHRLDDYRLVLGLRLIASGRVIPGLRKFAGISPLFFVHRIGVRLALMSKRTSRRIDAAIGAIR